LGLGPWRPNICLYKERWLAIKKEKGENIRLFFWRAFLERVPQLLPSLGLGEKKEDQEVAKLWRLKIIIFFTIEEGS